MNTKKLTQNWRFLTKPYQRPNSLKSWFQVVNSFAPFLFFCTLAYWFASFSILAMILSSFMAALFGVRIFIIQHDCGHGSFMKSRVWRDRIGYVCSFVTGVPYRAWQWEHAQHHAHSGNIDHGDIGEVTLYTAQEFLSLTERQRFYYRLYRYPMVMFLIGPAWIFFFSYRWAYWAQFKGQKQVAQSIWITNAYLIFMLSAGVYFFGWSFLFVYGLTIYFTAVIGVWLFYVQHQFEETYYERASEWDAQESALHGSSFFKLPKILQWFTGNIGFHHIHHLNPLIPNYELEKCHYENELFQEEAVTLTLSDCWATMQLKFWDEQRKKMITWSELKRYYLA